MISPFEQSFLDHRQTGERLEELYGKNFQSRSPLSFPLNNAELLCIARWQKALAPEIVAIQRPELDKLGISEIVDGAAPYYGAAGGGLTYSFTPTGLGNIITVTETVTGKTLNVSDALEWFFYG